MFLKAVWEMTRQRLGTDLESAGGEGAGAREQRSPREHDGNLLRSAVENHLQIRQGWSDHPVIHPLQKNICCFTIGCVLHRNDSAVSVL